MIGEQCWVLDISAPSGNFVSVHLSEAGAYDALTAYVGLCWEDVDRGEMPDDGSEAISQYFDDSAEESYTLTQTNISP